MIYLQCQRKMLKKNALKKRTSKKSANETWQVWKMTLVVDKKTRRSNKIYIISYVFHYWVLEWNLYEMYQWNNENNIHRVHLWNWQRFTISVAARVLFVWVYGCVCVCVPFSWIDFNGCYGAVTFNSVHWSLTQVNDCRSHSKCSICWITLIKCGNELNMKISTVTQSYVEFYSTSWADITRHTARKCKYHKTRRYFDL